MIHLMKLLGLVLEVVPFRDNSRQGLAQEISAGLALFFILISSDCAGIYTYAKNQARHVKFVLLMLIIP